MYHSSADTLAGQRTIGGQGHMTLPRLRDFCMSMPGATEQIQWGKDLVFKVGDKMFCVANTDPAGDEAAMSFKCDPEMFAELCERDGIRRSLRRTPSTSRVASSSAICC